VGSAAAVVLAMVAAHSPERKGNFCCAEQTAITMRTMTPNAAHFRKAISTHPFPV
jgi:hypothetical protein